jgi:hypothetical protein
MSKAPTTPSKVSSGSSGHGPNKARLPLKSGATAVETAKFVADFTTELSSLARNSQLDLLAYLLDMARLEAIRVVQANHRDS